MGADGKMMVVAVKATAAPSPSLEPGVPEALFQAKLARGPNNPLFEYDVTADGKRFLLDTVAGGGSASAPVLNAVVNWDTGLKK